MNNDKYYEFNIVPKNESKELVIKKVLSLIKLIFFVLAVFFLIIALFVNFSWFLSAFCFIVAFVLLFFQHRFYNFYDIIFVDGFLSVVKIVNNSKRKPLIRFQVSKIEKIGFVGCDTYNFAIDDKNVKKIYAVNNETSNDVCIHVKDYEDTLIILPYDERLIYCLVKYIGSSKLEKQFVERVKK